MKVIVAFLLIFCVSCGTAAAQSSPVPAPSPAPTPSPVPTATAAPTAAPAPDYRPCLTVLAYLAVHHHHEGPVTDAFGNPYISDATVPNRLPPFSTGLFADIETPQDLVDRFCDGFIDLPTLSAIEQQLDKR